MEGESGSRNGDKPNQNGDNTPLSQDTGGSGPARSQDHGDTPLHRCVRNKSLAALKDIVSSYDDKHSLKRAMISINDDGLTPPIMAASMDWDEGVDALLGTQVLDKADITHLVHQEIINKQWEVPRLDSKGSKYRTKVLPEIVLHTQSIDHNQWTIFTLTAAVGWLGGLKLLLKVGETIPLNKINGYNVLHIAIFSGNEEIPNLVLDAMDDGQRFEVVNYRKNCFSKLSPIFYAIKMQCCHLVRRLLQYVDADHVTTNTGYNILHHAARNAQPGSNGESGIWDILLEENHPRHDLINGMFMECYDNSSIGTPLHQAAMKGNLHSVRVLYKTCNKWLTAKDNDGWTPLHRAADAGRDEVIRYIVDKDARTLMATNDKGYTPLAIAIISNTNVELLLNLGVPSHKFGGSSPESKHETITTDDMNKSYGTTLCVATTCGNLKCVQTLHELYGVSLTTIDSEGKTPLHHAAKGTHETIRYIVEKDKTTLMTTDGNGYTPLAIAIKERAYSSNVELLLELGASHLELDDLKKAFFINKCDDDNKWLSSNPLLITIEYGNFKTFKILCKKYNYMLTSKYHKGWTHLHYAAANGKDVMIKYIIGLLGLSESLEATDNDGHTPLAIAIINNNASSIKLMLEQTAINHRNIYFLAECAGQPMTNLITDTLYGPTIRLAAKHGCIECVEFIYKEKNELLSNKDDKGWTPLHYAAAHSSDEVIRYIVIENSMTLKDKDDMGNTPLITAIVHKNESSVKLLLELGASLAETISKEAEDSLSPAETLNGSGIPPAGTPNVAYVPPEKTPNGFRIPLAERHTVSGIPPAETSNASLVENDRKSHFAKLFFKRGHEEKSALQLILDWWKNEKLAKDLFDSCIKGNVKDDSVGSINSLEGYVQLHFKIFQSEDGRWFNFVHLLQGRQEFLHHPVTESLVWQSTQDVKPQIYYNSAVHWVCLWFFYMLQTNEELARFYAVDLPFLFLWLIFVYIQNLNNQARWSTSFLISVVLFCSIFAAMVLTASRFFTPSELVITIPTLLFYQVFLRVVSYFDQAICTTFLHVVRAVGKFLMIAAIVIIIFVAIFMIKLDLQDPLNGFGKTLVNEVKKVYLKIDMKIAIDIIGIVIAVLTAIGHVISKMDLYVGWIKKHFEVKNKSDVGEAIIRQATVLESLSRSYLFNNSEFTKSINVYHDRKLDNNYHGSFIFGNRIWECVAEWYVNQSDPEREEDKKKFMEAKKKHCPLHTCLCEVISTQPIDTPKGQ